MSIRLGVLISGTGSNLKAILDAIDAGRLDAQVALVVASRPSAGGLAFAAAAGVETLSMSPEVYAADPLAADSVIAHELQKRQVDYVVMAGYMRMVRAPLLQAFPNRVVNLHPALLPSFQGAHAIEQAWKRGVKLTGVTVHFANEVYDQGPIIVQRAVAVEEGMSREELEAAIHAVEHVLYPEALQLLAQGRVHVLDDARVQIDPA